MQAQPSLTIQDYWSIVVRRKWLIVGMILVSFAVGVILTVILPKSYRSSALILVEDQKIPEDYVKGIVGGSIEERLTMIQQQVMSRTLLSPVIEEFQLYQNDIRKEGVQHVIEQVRKQIKVDTVGAKGPSVKSVEAFTISFSHENPMTAMKVTAKLTSQFIEQNLKVREQLVEGASEFLEQELRLAKDRLQVQERAISDFKSKYMGELPGQMEANLRALDRLQAELNSTTELQHVMAERLALIEKTIAEYKATGAITGGAVPGGLVSNQNGLDPLLMRHKELERNLVTLLAEYKDTYPDVIQLKQELAHVKRQLAEKYEAPDQEKGKGKGKEAKEKHIGIRFDPFLHELTKQRDSIQVDLMSLKERQRRLIEQKRLYEGRVERTPAREQELLILVRDYENMQKNYQSLLAKKLDARVAENLEKRQKGEQFRIIDPANLPEKPEQPDRVRIMFTSLAIGCALGVGLALAREQIVPVFRRPQDIEFVLGLDALASIPMFRLVEQGGIISDAGEWRRKAQQGLSASSEADRWDYWKPSRWGSMGSDREDSVESFPTVGGLYKKTLVAKWCPLGLASEQFRVVATRLVRLEDGRSSTVVVITSAVSGEGKSTVAANLAYTLAQDLGKTCLLIDCDLKRPVMHAYMDVVSRPGLVDLLHGSEDMEDCLQRVDGLSLWVLPVGHAEGRLTELAKVGKLKELLHELRNQFEYVLVDAPPILPLADMNVLSGMADIVALVVRAGMTRCEVVKQAVHALRLKGQYAVILNGVEIDGMPYYMRQEYLLEHESSRRIERV